MRSDRLGPDWVDCIRERGHLYTHRRSLTRSRWNRSTAEPFHPPQPKSLLQPDGNQDPCPQLRLCSPRLHFPPSKGGQYAVFHLPLAPAPAPAARPPSSLSRGSPINGGARSNPSELRRTGQPPSSTVDVVGTEPWSCLFAGRIVSHVHTVRRWTRPGQKSMLYGRARLPTGFVQQSYEYFRSFPVVMWWLPSTP